jgi:hypothetical protein
MFDSTAIQRGTSVSGKKAPERKNMGKTRI